MCETMRGGRERGIGIAPSLTLISFWHAQSATRTPELATDASCQLPVTSCLSLCPPNPHPCAPSAIVSWQLSVLLGYLQWKMFVDCFCDKKSMLRAQCAVRFIVCHCHIVVWAVFNKFSIANNLDDTL